MTPPREAAEAVGAVYVGRPSRWGNPFKMLRGAAPDHAVRPRGLALGVPRCNRATRRAIVGSVADLPPGTLAPKQQRAAEILARGLPGPVTDLLAKELKVNRRTAVRWKHDPAIQAEVARIRSERVQGARAALEMLLGRAVDVIREALDGDSAERLRAAEAVLDRCGLPRDKGGRHTVDVTSAGHPIEGVTPQALVEAVALLRERVKEGT